MSARHRKQRRAAIDALIKKVWAPTPSPFIAPADVQEWRNLNHLKDTR